MRSWDMLSPEFFLQMVILKSLPFEAIVNKEMITDYVVKLHKNSKNRLSTNKFIGHSC